MIIWYKVTEKWSSGYGDENYVYFETSINDTTLGDKLEELEEEYNLKNSYSDHWRGIKLEAVFSPPERWLNNEIKSTERKIKGLQNYTEILKDVAAPRY